MHEPYCLQRSCNFLHLFPHSGISGIFSNNGSSHCSWVECHILRVCSHKCCRLDVGWCSCILIVTVWIIRLPNENCGKCWVLFSKTKAVFFFLSLQLLQMWKAPLCGSVQKSSSRSSKPCVVVGCKSVECGETSSCCWSGEAVGCVRHRRPHHQACHVRDRHGVSWRKTEQRKWGRVEMKDSKSTGGKPPSEG